MKKILALFLIAGMVSFVACGPNKKDKEKEQKRLDSLKQDSIAKAKEADSLAAVEKAQKKQDSIRADSISKAKKDKNRNQKHKMFLNPKSKN